MKRAVSILLLALMAVVNVQASDRAFDFRDAGKVNYLDMEREISPGLDYAKVEILDIRHSYNPIAYLSSLTSDYNSYVITMIVNKTSKVTCDLFEITDERSMMIKQCKGGRREVEHVGFLYYENLRD